MMKLPRTLVPLSALVVAWIAAPPAARPATAQAVPAVAAAPAGQQEEKPAQTEADKKFAEIMQAVRKETDANKVVAALEQFIKENPTFPRLEAAYSSLLMYAARPKADPDKALALADEALARFSSPTSPARVGAVRAKYTALKALKRDEALKEFSGKLLESETSPTVLQAAAQADQASAVKLLEKAIAERSKREDAAAPPTLDVLKWDYSQALNRAGRKEEGLKLAQESLAESVKTIADLEALPQGDPKRGRASSLRMMLGSRYQALATTLSAAGDHDKALEYLALAEKNAANPLENTSRFETLRAGIYDKMGKPDLVLESYVRAFAARMDKSNRDKLLEAASKNGLSAADAYDRARTVRRANALAVNGFELKTMDGGTATLESFRSKVTLVNFFFPT